MIASTSSGPGIDMIGYVLMFLCEGSQKKVTLLEDVLNGAGRRMISDNVSVDG